MKIATLQQPFQKHNEAQQRYLTQSFQSAGTKPVGKFAIKFFETMNSSVAANFLVLDFFGMVLPRVWQAYNRNSEELGHKNLAAAEEELIREIPTGPGLVIAPILFSLSIGKWLGKSINTPIHLLDEYLTITKTLVAERKSLAPNKPLGVDTFFEKILELSIPSHYKNRALLITDLKNTFNNNPNNYVQKAKEIISNYNKLNGTFKERPFHISYPSVTLKPQKLLDGNISQLISTTKNYYTDVIAKIGNHLDHPLVEKMIQNKHVNIVAGRILNSIAGIYIAIATFKYAALFYSTRHKVFPGLYGLDQQFQYTNKYDLQQVKYHRQQQTHPVQEWLK